MLRSPLSPLTALALLVATAGPAAPQATAELAPGLVATVPAAVADTVELDPDPAAYVLAPLAVRAPGFRVLVQGPDGELSEVQPPPARTVQGHRRGAPAMRVVGGLHPRKGFQGSLAPVALGASGGTAAAGSGSVRVVELAVDADFEHFVALGSSVADTVADVESIVAGANAVFEASTGVRFLLTGVVVRAAEPDPYPSSDLQELLDDVLATWQAETIPFDVVQLFTGKSLGGIVSLAFTGVNVCSATQFHTIVASTSSSLSTLTQRTKVHAGALAVQFGNSFCTAGTPGCFGVTCSPLSSLCDPLLAMTPAVAAQVDAVAATAPCLDDAPATPPSFAAFGCGLNPPGSLVVQAGSPVVGATMTFALNNPFATQAAGALPFLSVSVAADPAFPCGTPVPGLGMSTPGATGELLIGVGAGQLVLAGLGGSPWSPGVPGEVVVPIPPLLALVGFDVFAQGVLVDLAPGAGVPLGLTSGLRVTLGL
ncbi:MAG: zinc-dependent metalloprotease family protein [Planctomycetota bacterium]